MPHFPILGFAAGTPIRTASGNKLIEDVNVGDIIRSGPNDGALQIPVRDVSRTIQFEHQLVASAQRLLRPLEIYNPYAPRLTFTHDKPRLLNRRVMAADAPVAIARDGQLRLIDPISGWRIVDPQGGAQPLLQLP